MSENELVLPDDIIGITITYKQPVSFYLRMVSIGEENRIREKLDGLTDDEREERFYDVNVETLAELTQSPPSDDKTALTDSQAVKEFFAERTTVKERIAEYAMRAYLIKLAPEISFI